MLRDDKIYVAGHRGLVGSAVVRCLRQHGFENIIGRSHAELDLTDQRAVADFFVKERPRYVVLAAAKVGGIHANATHPGEFIHSNLAIQSHVLHHSYLHGVDRLIFLGSSCIYPKLCPQPIKEEYLMTGPLEITNSAYAVAKIAGIEMCWAYNQQYGCRFIPLMPTNLYGENDNFDLENAHVLPALIRKFHLAKLASTGNWVAIEKDQERFGIIPADVRDALGWKAGQINCSSHRANKPRVIIWGTGTPMREFLYVDDLAEACVHILSLAEAEIAQQLASQSRLLINIGTGVDCTIGELSYIVQEVVGFDGPVVFDQTRPNGTPQKLLDVSKAHQLGWYAKIQLREGIRRVYEWYQQKSHGCLFSIVPSNGSY